MCIKRSCSMRLYSFAAIPKILSDKSQIIAAVCSVWLPQSRASTHQHRSCSTWRSEVSHILCPDFQEKKKKKIIRNQTVVKLTICLLIWSWVGQLCFTLSWSLHQSAFGHWICSFQRCLGRRIADLCLTLKSEGKEVHELGKERSTAMLNLLPPGRGRQSWRMFSPGKEKSTCCGER